MFTCLLFIIYLLLVFEAKNVWGIVFFRTKFCTYVREDGNISLVDEVEKKHKGRNREKRQAIDPYNWEPVQTRCSLLLVADFRFYENMGGRNLKGTINFLVNTHYTLLYIIKS